MLLAVFVPMLVFSTLHVHSSDFSIQSTCSECVHHHCGGHLAQHLDAMHDCVLCQFLTLPLMVVAVAAIVAYVKGCMILFAQSQEVLPAQTLGVVVTRGPPVV